MKAISCSNGGFSYSLNVETGYGSFTQFYAPRQKVASEVPTQAPSPVFGDGAATRERMA